MSIISAVQEFKTARFVIPLPGKMQRSNISKTNQAICFCINKGYFEVYDETTMRNILTDITQVSNKVLTVGSVDTLKVNGQLTYRQRVFCKSFRVLLNICRVNGITIVLSDSFQITINSVMNCLSDVPYMEHYAMKYGELIDDWLTNCLILHIHYLLIGLNMYSEYGEVAEQILSGKVGYCDRAPFLLSEFNRDEKRSSVFMDLDNEDIRMFTTNVGENYAKVYGLTTDNIALDLKEGVFRDKK